MAQLMEQAAVSDIPFGFEPGSIITMPHLLERGWETISATVVGWSSHGMVISEDGIELRIVPLEAIGKWRAIHPDYREELTF